MSQTSRTRGGHLELRLLGELQLVFNGREIPLPASKKTRALLAYLVATAGPHRREWLCDLLWEGPDDPRGELRWSLAKIRPLLDAGGTIRLKTDRSRVAFEPHGAVVDLIAVRKLLDDIANAPLDTLRAATALFRGEFLDGLDLPACYRFQEWCLTERSAVSALRLNALGALVDRLRDDPEEALVHARRLVAADPLSEAGHASVVRLLGRLGRRREAFAQYEQARSVLERELGVSLSGALESARRAIVPESFAPVRRSERATIEEDGTTGRWPRPSVPFVGRRVERAHVDRLVSAAADGRTARILLVTGEPGIGKSHLLDHLAERVTTVGGLCLQGRAFEAEAARPYGAWIDALRTIPAESVPEDVRRNLALLRPEWGPAAGPPDRARLFGAVLSLLRHLSGQAPLVVMLDDVQWLDEASSTLFHYLARKPNAPDAALFACAARSGELADNPAVSRMLRALEKDQRVLEIPLVALSAPETAELVRAIDPAIDAAAVFGESDGNPLFALELSRTHREGRHSPGRSLQAVIAQQVATLGEPCRRVVAWASTMGRTFGPDLLARLAGVENPTFLSVLEKLERRSIFRTAGTDTYDFTHDLVRRAAYQEISQPRRKLMHRQIALVLGAMVERDEALAGDLARHAELADDPALAARACIIAGERSLRLFANAEAAALARRGLSHVDRLPDQPLRHELRIRLLKVDVLAAAGPALRPLPQVVTELSRSVVKVEEAGMHAAAATGHYLLSVLHQETGDTARAQDSTVHAALAGRGADPLTYARQLANTARCLIELETEIPRARALLGRADDLLGTAGASVCELQWGYGLLQRWHGNQNETVALIEGALALAREAGDRWREYKCLTWLCRTAFELGRNTAARDWCHELRAVAERLGEDEAPFADAIEALAACAESGGPLTDRLNAALSRLRAVDDKSYLAYTLNAVAALCVGREQPAAGEAYAREALNVATAMERHNEIVIAGALLARIEASRSPQAAEEALGRLVEQVADADRFNARARAAVGEAVAGVLALRTVTPTLATKDEKRRPGR